MTDVGISKRAGLLVLSVVVGILIVVSMTATNYRQTLNSSLYTPTTDSQYSASDVMRQRNELSWMLNQQKKLYGQMSCKMNKLRQKAGEAVDGDVSENGGWCATISGSDSASHRFDEGFAKSLSHFLRGKHVASFGDGPGDYKKALDSYKEVASYTAYDGAPFCESTTDGRVKFLDLSGPQYGLQAFDWVVSVEVGEHIPAKFEDIYLDNLVRHAKEGVVLSWAVPGKLDGSFLYNHRIMRNISGARVYGQLF